MTETWKAVPGRGEYEVSDLGNVRSLISGRVLAQRKSNRGYQLVNLARYKWTGTVHTLVLAAFTGPPPVGTVARHLDDDPQNNRLDNLVWGTPSENERDKFRNGSRKPAAPKPIRYCNCGAVLTTNGKRCHPCVVKLAIDATERLWSGSTLAQVAEDLDYPAAHLHTLAVKHGGYGRSPLRWRLARVLRGGHRA